MTSTIILVLFYVFSPLLLLYLVHNYTFLKKIGAIVLAYALGLVIGITGLMPENSMEIQNLLTTITIPLAIPLMLFSSNVKSWLKLAGKTSISMIIAIFSVISTVIGGYLLFGGNDPENMSKVGGLLIGVYTGGTPNLAALKLMLNVDNEVYLMTNAYDMLIGAAYFFFIIIAGQKVFGIILPKYKSVVSAGDQKMVDVSSKEPFWGLLNKKNTKPLLIAFVISALIFGLAGATTLIVPKNSQMVVVVLIITTLGILASLIPSINKLSNTFDLGMYLILIFSIVVASMVDLSKMMEISSEIFYYVGFVIFGSLLMHVLLSAIFKIDTDTVLITSTALICSPPFVPAVAGALNNREIVVSGLTVGIVGYAVGNYLGFLIANLLIHI
ncbi:MAG: DUF819 family protein [Chlorobi bacterium]|nr:DUF819 family protein [Chlorobiota bacterium]